MVKASSSNPDSQEINEIIEAASTQADSKEVSEMVETASTQPRGHEETSEMDEAAFTQSDIQTAIKNERKKLAETLGGLKDSMKRLVSEKKVDLNRYRSLVSAIYQKKVKEVEDFINENQKALLDAHLDESGNTIFHLIVQVPGTDRLTEELVSKASPEFVERKSMTTGCTALHKAALSGNTKAAKLFVKKSRDLLTIKDDDGLLPVDRAIEFGHCKETVEYLLSESCISSAYVLCGLIEANYIDLALGLLTENPNLAVRNGDGRYWNKTINELARKPLGLPSGSWQSLIYHYIPVKVEKHNSRSEHGDIENQTQTSRKAILFGKLHDMLWAALMSLVPGIKYIHDQKLMHVQTLEIVRRMIAEVTWTFQDASESLKKPILAAAKSGNYQFAGEILKAYNSSFLFYDKHGHTIFHRAVLYRQQDVFNLIHIQLPLVKKWIYVMKDDTKCNILHLAGRLVPSNKVPGAALQMQRELQWYKAVEDMFHPSIQDERNLYKRRPRDEFTKEHKILVKEGEKWMKETATACSVVAALIITVIFATAYTFPGGINGEGVPNFLHKTSFKVFFVSIALALVSSTTSVQMFLGILTSRYAEEDFLKSLPKKLITGLVTLFLSIASMMVAFASTFHIFLQPWKWVTFIMAALVFVPVTLFAFMQFPLLVDIFKSTYGFNILKSKK